MLEAMYGQGRDSLPFISWFHSLSHFKDRRPKLHQLPGSAGCILGAHGTTGAVFKRSVDPSAKQCRSNQVLLSTGGTRSLDLHYFYHRQYASPVHTPKLK